MTHLRETTDRLSWVVFPRRAWIAGSFVMVVGLFAVTGLLSRNADTWLALVVGMTITAAGGAMAISGGAVRSYDIALNTGELRVSHLGPFGMVEGRHDRAEVAEVGVERRLLKQHDKLQTSYRVVIELSPGGRLRLPWTSERHDAVIFARALRLAGANRIASPLRNAA